MSIKSVDLGMVNVQVKLIAVVGKSGFNAKLSFNGLEPILEKQGYQILSSETRTKGSGSPLATRIRLKQISQHT